LWEGERCPRCDGPLRLVGFVLCLRTQDQKRVCKAPLWCAPCDSVWSRWVDRNDPLQLDVPIPESYKRRLLDR
jgi:hypothetical protein